MASLTARICSATRASFEPWSDDRLVDTSLEGRVLLADVDKASRPDGLPRPAFCTEPRFNTLGVDRGADVYLNLLNKELTYTLVISGNRH